MFVEGNPNGLVDGCGAGVVKLGVCWVVCVCDPKGLWPVVRGVVVDWGVPKDVPVPKEGVDEG